MKDRPASRGPSQALKAEAPPARCPFCGGQDTELYALFGSQLSTSQYYCRACRTAFEQMKWAAPSRTEG